MVFILINQDVHVPVVKFKLSYKVRPRCHVFWGKLLAWPVNHINEGF